MAPPVECAIALQKVQLAMYQLVCTIVLGLWGNAQTIFSFSPGMTRVFPGTFMKDKRGVADMRADLQSLCRAKTNKPGTDHQRLSNYRNADDA